MSASLLLIALGPVQDFIAQARRTRDLWYGSHLLSELSRAAARTLTDGGADLIFPALEPSDPELEPCEGPLRPNGVPPLAVANKLLAYVPETTDPAALAHHVRSKVARFWREDIAGRVHLRCSDVLAEGVESVWEEQVDTFLEFTATWTRLADHPDYPAARRAVERSMASRKWLRDFPAWHHRRAGAPKSSLDGARESVLAPGDQRNADLVRRYRIVGQEELDAVGLIKRAGGKPRQFVPVINVALASWIALAAKGAATHLEHLRRACREKGVARVERPDLPCAQQFEFDASILLPSRWRTVFAEQGLQGDPVAWGREHVAPLLARLSEPFPYVAFLVADGDHMGRALDRFGSPEAHRTFSRALAHFAASAREVVEKDHLGALVYSGGDDALGFLPVAEALACADELRRTFDDVVASAGADLPLGERPTLSVGIGVGHVMEGMGDLRELGREAERLAKSGAGATGGRNALAVVVDRRSGGKRAWCQRWPADPVGRLRQDTALLTEGLSSRKVYEVARTLARLPRGGASPDEGWSRVLALEVRRSLARVEAGQASVRPAEAGLDTDESHPYAAMHDEVSAWVDRLLVARIFKQAEPALRQAVR